MTMELHVFRAISEEVCIYLHTCGHANARGATKLCTAMSTGFIYWFLHDSIFWVQGVGRALTIGFVLDNAFISLFNTYNAY
jgi:hypothetical protein